MVFFIADMHLGHAGIIGLAARPFNNVEEMDEVIISRWNKKVAANDTVYILGDICMRPSLIDGYLKRLKGKKILVVGNHDSFGVAVSSDAFDRVLRLEETSLNGKKVTLCHYPLLEWNGSRSEPPKDKAYLIFGHIHNRIDELFRPLYLADNALNAGVEINDYAPVTFDELIENNARFSAHALSILDRIAALEKGEVVEGKKLVKMKLAPEPFSFVRRGVKTIEVRLYDDKRRILNVGDVIKFTKCDDENAYTYVEVTGLKAYRDFKELYSTEDLFGTGATDIESAVEGMKAYYDEEKQSKFGALAIRFKVLTR